MTYKQIEASRELRLWIGQIVIPAVGVSAVLLSNPEIKRAVEEKADSLKRRLPWNKNRIIR